MDAPDLTSYIIDRLSDAVTPDDIILDICDKNGMSWPEAKAFVEQVQAEHEQEVTKRQFPLLTLLALSIFVGGVGLLAYAIYIQEFNRIWSQGHDPDPNKITCK